MNYKWFIGIDISKKTFDAVLFKNDLQKKSPHSKFDNNQNGYKALKQWLSKQKVILSDALFCIEHTGVYGLELTELISNESNCCIESPLHIKRSLGITRGKNDKVDAFQISRFCYIHKEELKPKEVPKKVMLTLKFLINERERLVKIRSIDKVIIKELNRKENAGCIARCKKRIKSITRDINQIEKEIEDAILNNQDLKKNYLLIKSVVGIGLVNSVLFIVFTNNFKSINNARKYACYSGIAPFEHSSGTSIRGKTRVSKLANNRIKVNLTNGARSAIINDPEIKLYYERKTAEGKEHGTVMNAVKFKLITRVFATVNRGTPYVKMRIAG